MKLQNRTALVTGASRGLGRAIAIALAEEGANVIVNFAQNEVLAEEVVTKIESMGRKAISIQADVRQTSEVSEMVKTAITAFGKIDVLVNNACVYSDSTVGKMADEVWDEVVDTCLTGVFRCTRSTIDHMREQQYGRIVNISSVVGQIGVFGTSNYSAAKAGLFGFTKAVAKEVARKGITVNALTLGYFEAGMLLRLPEEIQDSIKEQIPLRRFGTTKELTDTVVFLVSDGASYLTGQVIHLNGGVYM
ncbi:MAG: 3-oxoacyl-ACP reductase family protein [Candidatus Thorarchaeota archaeon]|jgi:3-oxoacyl-[acyl-carrier protein] reductase